MSKPADMSPLKRAYRALEESSKRIEELESARREPLAIVGAACRMPGGIADLDGLWDALVEKRDAIREIPAERFDVDAYFDPDPQAPGKMTTRWAAMLDDVDRADARFFDVIPREMASMDPQQRLLLEVAWEALESAGRAGPELRGSATGAFVAVSSNDYAQLALRATGFAGIDTYFASGVAQSMASGRLSFTFGLRGPSVTVDTACSSSLVAVHLAGRSLRNGECRMALAGGVNLMLAPDNFISLSRYQMMAPDGKVKAFDAGADGFVRGEGCGMVVLKRLSDALEDRDPILAVIRGTACNQDGPSSGLTAPNGPAQEEVIAAALDDAGLDPADVDYVEAHGTGTALGDPIEANALGAAYAPGRASERPLVVGSLKANFGHMESAAGIAGLLKTVLVLRHGRAPAQIHLDEPNPLIPWARLPLALPRDATEVTAPDDRPRRGAVSSFGFSGTNVHAVLEAAPATATARDASAAAANAIDRPLHLLRLSARSDDALVALAGRMESAFSAAATASPATLADLCYTANAGRAELTHRAVVVGADASALAGACGRLAAGDPSPGTIRGTVEGGDRPKIAFLFTGQGSQYPGMGKELYRTQPTYREEIDRCEDVLAPALGRSVRALLLGEADDPEAIHRTELTQPALFVVEYALARLWESWGVRPSALAGHSVGEYVAACLAGVIGLEDALRLIAARARLMGELPEGGAMAAVFAAEATVADAVEAAVAEGGGALGIAAINGPKHVVISGDAETVERARRALKEAGHGSKPLKVSHAFHSPRMEPMLEAFREEAGRVAFGVPRMRVVSNRTGEIARGRAMSDAVYWVDHVREPVRFARSMETLREAGIRAFLEVGPHPVLLGMGRACVPDEDDALWLPSLRRGKEDWTQLLDSVARLECAGAEIDWEGFDRDYARRRRPLPTYPFQRKRHWIAGAGSAPVAAGVAGAAPGTNAGIAPAGRGGAALLGVRVRTALPARIHQTVIDPATLPLLDDHRLFGRAVMPATGYFEIALQAARAELGDVPCRLEDGVIGEALVVGDAPRVVQCVVEDDPGGARRWRVASTPLDAADGERWTTHASGAIAPAGSGSGAGGAAGAGAADAQELDAIRKRCTATVEGADHYRRFAELGLDFGPTLHGVRRIARRDGEALAEVELPAVAAGADDADAYRLHPALMDACLQAIAAAQPSTVDDGAVFVPVGFDRLAWHGPPGREVLSHVEIRAGEGGQTLSGSVRVLDPSGALRVAADGLRFKRIERAALERLGAPGIEDAFYTVDWRPRPPAAGPQPPMDPSELARAGAGSFDALAERHGLADYPQHVDRMESIATGFTVRALQMLGAGLRRGERLDTASLAREANIAGRFDRLLDRLVGFLADDGILARDGDAWTVTREPAVGDVETLTAELETIEREGTSLAAEATLLRRCGPRLADVLTGAVDPLALLFPGGSAEAAESLYRDTPGARTYSGCVGETLAEAARRRAEEGGGGLRILEVGAGTGGLTGHVLPALDAESVQRYVFTDLGTLFVHRAQEKFGDRAFMEFQAFDVEKDPVAQGLPASGFDVVLAANSLHATADLPRALAHARRLLAPGGLLALLEMTRPLRWIDITFGLTEGWWLFADREVRGDYVLLSQEGWLDLLRGAGFEEPAAIPAGATDATQSILLARAPAAAAAETWLLRADAGGVAEALATRAREAGRRCVLVPADAGAEVFRERIEAERPVRVVDLAALDADDRAMPAVQERAAGSLLGLAQAAVRAATPPALDVVTRGARAAGPVGGAVAPDRATLWGLARVVRLEHPEVRTRCIDLDPAVPAGDAGQVDLLLRELISSGDEPEVAFRGAERRVARLARWRPAGTDSGAGGDADTTPFRLEVAERGTLDNLKRVARERHAPGPGEVEIRVEATGLNFRDVLNVLGMYPGDPGPPGGECTGRVVAVGPGVEHLAVGDPAIALVGGCFASHVVAPAALTVRRPPGLDAARAATVGIPYVTAQFALHRLGKLRRGETVLIHAAAGGVGMAAVHLARRAGATIYATAGTPEKRRRVRALGADRVMNSRTLDYADEIDRLTEGQGVDLVVNSLADDHIGKSLALVREGGRFVEMGKRGLLEEQDVAALPRRIDYHAMDWSVDAEREPETVGRMLAELVADVASGALPALPVFTFPVERAVDAFRFMAQAKHTGKIAVVQPATARGPFAADAGRTYLITGAFGGLGLATAAWLVERGARNLLLLGRSEPVEAAQERIEALRAAGARVETRRVDVADGEALEAALAAARDALPPLAGVVHSAGALDDAALLQQSWSRFATVFGPKVYGAWNLHRATAGDELDFFVIYSSVASLFGSPGQANHAAANQFLDELAGFRRARGLPGVSIDWGAWTEIGAAAERGVDRSVRGRGLGAIAPEQGLEALRTVLEREPPAHVGVAPVDWAAFRALPGGDASFYEDFAAEAAVTVAATRAAGAATGGRAAGAAAAATAGIVAELQQAEPAVRPRRLTEFVTGRIAALLGMEDDGSIDPVRPVSEQGVDSLMAVELRNVLKRELEIEEALPATLVFDHPTAEAISRFLLDEVLGLGGGDGDGSAPGGPPAPGGDDDDPLSRIEELSDDEAARLLSE